VQTPATKWQKQIMTTLIVASPEAFRPNNTRKSYSVTEKVRILNDLDATGGWIKRTAKDNGIPESCLRRWKQNRSSLEGKAGLVGCRARRVSDDKRKPLHGDGIEQHLLSFVDSRRENSFHVTPRMLIAEWTKVDPEGVSLLSVNAARARIYRFMRRNELSFRRTTHQAQVTRTNPQVITDFVSYCNWKAKLLGVSPECIANFDETNVYFSPPIRSTIAHKGSKTVAIRTPDSNNRCTAMLGVTMAGYKFPPYIVYSGKVTRCGRIRRELANARANHYPPGLVYQCQEKAWMDEATMLDWVETVWKPFTESVNSKPTLLLLDWAPAHVVSSVKAAIATCNTELEFVPKGYTSKCQVLDVGINKPFSDYIRNNVADWQVSHDFNDKPLRQDVAHWIRLAWLEIKVSTITNTWKHIGFEAQGTGDIVVNMIDVMEGVGVISGDTGSVNDEDQLDPLAYNTCVEDSDSDTEESTEDEFAVR